MRNRIGFLKVRAFTLIELLVVVAIISILATISLPNILEAQIRAKSTRVLADMRTVGMALELYLFDHNCYPPARVAHDNLDGKLSLRTFRLTTPVAYLNSLPPEVFPPLHGWNGQIDNGLLQFESFDTFDYFDAKSDWDEDMRFRSEGGVGTDSTRGAYWRLASCGPDLWASFGIIWGPRVSSNDREGMTYDPTNGTLSNGDIVLTGPPLRAWSPAMALAGR